MDTSRIRGSVHEHGCLAPNTAEPWTKVKVRFPNSLKAYTYWAPLRWDLKHSDTVQVWVSEREGYKNVTVIEAAPRGYVGSDRALKALSAVVSRAKQVEKNYASLRECGNYPPKESTSKWTVAHVEFEPGGKQYTYWVRTRWGVAKGDFLRGHRDASNSFVFGHVVEVASGEFESLSAPRKVAIGYRKAEDTSVLRAAWARPWLTKTVAMDFETTPSLSGLNLTKYEDRIAIAMAPSAGQASACKPDMYKAIAEFYARYGSNPTSDNERFLGKHPALGAPYSLNDTLKKRAGEVIHRQVEAGFQQAAITGKRITGVIFDDPVADNNKAYFRYFPSNIPKKSQEDTVELKIETKTFLNGTDVNTMSPAHLFAHIQNVENEIRRLSTLVNQPKKVRDYVASLEKGLDALMKAVDGEDAAYKPVTVRSDSEGEADTADTAAPQG